MILKLLQPYVYLNAFRFGTFLCTILAFGRANANENNPPANAPIEKNEPFENSPLLSHTTLSHRVPLSTLLSTTVAQSTHASVYSWRKSPLSLEIFGSQIIEYNTFNSEKLGLKVRIPAQSAQFTMSWSLVKTSSTSASDIIGKTPYRQAGRPSRHEISFGGEAAVAEGISTWMPSFLGESQLVLYVTADLTLALYPKAWARNEGIEKLTSFFKPTLTSPEISELSQSRPSGMAVNTARYFTGVGTRLDLISEDGAYLHTGFNLLIPLIKGENEIGYVVIPHLGVGYAFSP